MSTGSEMKFYKELASQHNFPMPQQTTTQEEQVLKIRLQSRRSLKMQSPLNRASFQANHRSCVRIRSSIRMTTTSNGISPQSNVISEEVVADKHAENCGHDECEHDHNVIVVRTAQETIVGGTTVRGSFIGKPMTLKGSPVNIDPNDGKDITLARFGNQAPAEKPQEENKRGATVAVQAQLARKDTINKQRCNMDPQLIRAKTVTIPKDYREELRKLQMLKQKIGIAEGAVKEGGNGDCVTVSTLGNRDSVGKGQD